jgi:N-acetylneuraminic acid mutarotase
VSNLHTCFDISTQTWFSRAGLPTAVYSPGYGWIDGKFYVVGGYPGVGTNAIATLQIYDLASDTWSTGASLPTARAGQASGVVDGFLYSAGGSLTNSFPSDCPTYAYDPGANSWTTRSNCPLQSGSGFYMGGSVGSVKHHRLFAGGHLAAYYGWFAYDPLADHWETLANLPANVNRRPLIVENPVSGMLYQIGGETNTGAIQTAVNSYDYQINTWDASPPDLPAAWGSLIGPPQGSIGDPHIQGFWGFDSFLWGIMSSLRLWEHTLCPPEMVGVFLPLITR